MAYRHSFTCGASHKSPCSEFIYNRVYLECMGAVVTGQICVLGLALQATDVIMLDNEVSPPA